MAFWDFGRKIPVNIVRGGKLSDFGGPEKALEYRVWVTTADGRRFFFGDKEFAGVYIAWRRAQQDLDYYKDIELPQAVVWDPGIRAHREVLPDTIMSYYRVEYPDFAKLARERLERQKSEAEKYEESERDRILKEIEKAAKSEGKVKTGTIKVSGSGKSKKREFVNEAASGLEKEVMQEETKGLEKVAKKREAAGDAEQQEQANPYKMSREELLSIAAEMADRYAFDLDPHRYTSQDVLDYLTRNYPAVIDAMAATDLAVIRRAVNRERGYKDNRRNPEPYHWQPDGSGLMRGRHERCD